MKPNNHRFNPESRSLPPPAWLAGGLLGLLLLSGCASIEHSLIADNAADKKATGFRYYITAPYLLVYADGKGGIVWKIYHLPDQTRKMNAAPDNFMAKVTTTMSFTDGMLTEAADEGDSTEIPKAIISAVEKYLPALLAANGAAEPHAIPAPYLYRIVVRNGSITFVGGQAATGISTTIRPGGKAS